jgi:hypothetical protein
MQEKAHVMWEPSMEAKEALQKTRAWIESEIERANLPNADKFDLTSLAYCVSKAVGPGHYDEEVAALQLLRAVTLSRKMARHDVVDTTEALDIVAHALVLTLKDGRYAAKLRELGFVKTGEEKNPDIVAMLNRLQCCMYFAYTDPSKTYVTDELGQDWEANAEVDLKRFKGFKAPWTFNNEPEMQGPVPSSSKH